MRKLTLLMVLTLVFIWLTGCTPAVTEPENYADSGDASTRDTEASALFELAVYDIMTLASKDPPSLIAYILGSDIQVIYEEKEIDGTVYYETTAAYADLYDFYAETFTGDALRWVLSTKFADVDGTLYCSPVGGASGWVVTDIAVESVGQQGDDYYYVATFTEFEDTGTSRFTLQNTDFGYRISSIDYRPSLLESE